MKSTSPDKIKVTFWTGRSGFKPDSNCFSRHLQHTEQCTVVPAWLLAHRAPSFKNRWPWSMLTQSSLFLAVCLPTRIRPQRQRQRRQQCQRTKLAAVQQEMTGSASYTHYSVSVPTFRPADNSDPRTNCLELEWINTTALVASRTSPARSKAV